MIEPTVSLFYDILTETFPGGYTFATRAVNKIKLVPAKDKQTPTLSMDGNGIIRVNVGFWRKYVKTKTDAKFVFLHEMFHSVLGDTTTMRSAKDKFEAELMNLSMDIRINSAIFNYLLRPAEKSKRLLTTKLYSASGIAGLMRSYSQYSSKSKFALLYRALYMPNELTSSQKDKVEQMFQNEETIRSALKILINNTKANQKMLGKMQFIGSHDLEAEVSKKGDNDKTEEELTQDNEGGEREEVEAPEMLPEDTEVEEIPEDLADDMRDALIQAMRAGGKEAGMSGIIFDNMVEVIESSKSVQMHALQAFACDHKVNQIKSMFVKERKISSMVPLQPSNKELVLLAAGMTPIRWTNRKVQKDHLNRNIAVYLDVSGSVHSHLPKLLGVIANLRQNIKTVYCFSNEVHAHSMTELNEGKFRTTGGTDFDCIVDHAVENEIDKMIILTDGCAWISPKQKEEAREKIKDAAIIFFGYKNEDNFFSNQYKKNFNLEDLIK